MGKTVAMATGSVTVAELKGKLGLLRLGQMRHYEVLDWLMGEDAVKPKQEGIVGAILAGVAAVHGTPIDTELNKLRQYVIIAD